MFAPPANREPAAPEWTAKKRALVTLAEIENVAAAGFKPAFRQGRLITTGEQGEPLQNAQQLSDYIKLMAFSGGRRNETLRLTWADVDWNQKQVTLVATAWPKPEGAHR